MAGRVSDAITFSFAAESRVVPDANIWLYLFPPPSNPNVPPEISTYTRVIKRAREAKSVLYLHALVLGEYLNRYLKIEWEANGRGRPLDKAARRGAEYRGYISLAAAYASQILAMAKPMDLPFSAFPVADLINTFSRGATDWNDQLLGTSCLQAKYLFLTHDYDFANQGLDVLTANPKLLGTMR